jgi:hypothetical protein
VLNPDSIGSSPRLLNRDIVAPKVLADPSMIDNQEGMLMQRNVTADRVELEKLLDDEGNNKIDEDYVHKGIEEDGDETELSLDDM